MSLVSSPGSKVYDENVPPSAREGVPTAKGPASGEIRRIELAHKPGPIRASSQLSLNKKDE